MSVKELRKFEISEFTDIKYSGEYRKFDNSSMVNWVVLRDFRSGESKAALCIHEDRSVKLTIGESVTHLSEQDFEKLRLMYHVLLLGDPKSVKKNLIREQVQVDVEV